MKIISSEMIEPHRLAGAETFCRPKLTVRICFLEFTRFRRDRSVPDSNGNHSSDHNFSHGQNARPVDRMPFLFFNESLYINDLSLASLLPYRIKDSLICNSAPFRQSPPIGCLKLSSLFLPPKRVTLKFFIQQSITVGQ